MQTEAAEFEQVVHESRVRGRIMVVDDEAVIRKIITMMLEEDNYEVTTHGTPSAAIDEIRKNPGRFDVVLTDLRLPKESGIDVLREVGEIDETIVRIVMTGYATVENAVSCLREGVYDFIQKPIEYFQLSALVRRAIEYRELIRERTQYQLRLEDMVRQRSAQLVASLEVVRKSYDFTLEALVAMLDAREHQVGKHSLRTRDLTFKLASHMGLGAQELEAVAHGALLHDIGKIGIPDSILLRPGPLTPEEWEVMKKHPEIGHNILRSSPYLKEAGEIVWQHQENYDGSGYPRGLKGEQICIGARIFRVIDAYDAMCSERVYTKQRSPREALGEISKNSGKQFDPQVVKAFLESQSDIG